MAIPVARTINPVLLFICTAVFLKWLTMVNNGVE